ncbi:GNAT family N-acetyltransferase [Pontibacter sp. H259]|uniref:GNAT family N-acetyltransferase n=1 Tax=Pontibacter sp. H259 TaxID=3133421 RepID=UPI0030C29FED
MIVEATPDDIDELFPLWQELMQQHQPYSKVFKTKPGHEQALKHELLSRLKEKGTQVFVYEAHGTLAGMIICQLKQSIKGFELSRKGYLAETIVKKEYRGQGIGKELFEAAQNWLQDNGADHIELQVAVKNEAAIRFWEELGFTPATQHMVLLLK